MFQTIRAFVVYFWVFEFSEPATSRGKPAKAEESCQLTLIICDTMEEKICLEQMWLSFKS